MKISLDIRPILDNQKTGIGYFTYEIVNRLIRDFNEHKYYLNYFGNRRLNDAACSLIDAKNVKESVCKWCSSYIYRIVTTFVPIPYAFFFKSKSDITIFFNYYVPFKASGKVITVVHDITHVRHPETVSLKTKVFLKMTLRKSIKRADCVIATSYFTRKEISAYYKIDKSKIKVVPCGIDHDRFHSHYTEQQVEKAKAAYGITSDYILYIGTIEPRKNLVRLIKAYHQAYLHNPEIPKLVLAGKDGWLNKEIYRIVDTLGSERVLFTGYVNEDDVPVLMKGALAFVFPSIYEGFGMPPLEAMACGTPVLSSDRASLPEVLGVHALYFDPLSIKQMSSVIGRIVEDVQLRDGLSKTGLNWVKKFRWDVSAKKVMDICAVLEI